MTVVPANENKYMPETINGSRVSVKAGYTRSRGAKRARASAVSFCGTGSQGCSGWKGGKWHGRGRATVEIEGGRFGNERAERQGEAAAWVGGDWCVLARAPAVIHYNGVCLFLLGPYQDSRRWRWVHEPQARKRAIQAEANPDDFWGLSQNRV